MKCGDEIDIEFLGEIRKASLFMKGNSFAYYSPFNGQLTKIGAPVKNEHRVTLITEHRPTGQIYFCFFCGGPGSTKHHLFPRSIADRIGASKEQKQKVIRLCPRCHQDVHFYFSHYELATRFNDHVKLKLEWQVRKNWKLPEEVFKW